MKKNLFIVLIAIISSIFIYGCSIDVEDIIPSTIPLNDSIKEIILSKGEDYDFLSDELFINKLNELGLSNHLTIGNLDNDNIPEIVAYKERNPDDTTDQGKLEVYKFLVDKYTLLDSIDMNYDNTNYLLVAGKISETQNGILLSNQVGANAGVTYGYILENGKLRSILNDKKISLVSMNTTNEIKDIDNDGILEFSIYTIDPETDSQTAEESDKINLWYKWDGLDSGDLIQVEREAAQSDMSIMSISREVDALMSVDDINLEYLKENKSNYDKYELTRLVDEYISYLYMNISKKSEELENLFIKYQKENSFDFLYNKYGLSLERLNDIEYLKREKILQSEPDLKAHLVENLKSGYKIENSEGIFFYVIDNQEFVDSFGELVTKEYKHYLNIKAKYTNELYLSDGSLIISRDKLSNRIVEIEAFKITYPYSSYSDEVSELYKQYVLNFLYGNINTPNYDLQSKYSQGSIAVFQDTINKYPESYLSELLQAFINALNKNSYILTDEMRENINNFIG